MVCCQIQIKNFWSDVGHCSNSISKLGLTFFVLQIFKLLSGTKIDNTNVFEWSFLFKQNIFRFEISVNDLLFFVHECNSRENLFQDDGCIKRFKLLLLLHEFKQLSTRNKLRDDHESLLVFKPVVQCHDTWMVFDLLMNNNFVVKFFDMFVFHICLR